MRVLPKRPPKPGSDAMPIIDKLSKDLYCECQRYKLPALFAIGAQLFESQEDVSNIDCKAPKWQLAIFWMGGPADSTKEMLRQMLVNAPEFREAVRGLLLEVDALRL